MKTGKDHSISEDYSALARLQDPFSTNRVALLPNSEAVYSVQAPTEARANLNDVGSIVSNSDGGLLRQL